MIDQRPRLPRAGDDDDLPNGFFPTPQRTGELSVDQSTRSFQVFDDSIARAQRVMNMNSLFGLFVDCINRF